MDLREARFKAKKTQWSVRLFTNINQTKLSLIENGYVFPSEDEKHKIAEALEMEATDITWPEPEVQHAG